MRRFVASVAVLLVAGCGADAPAVDWGGKYSDSVKERLDELAHQKDCGRLLAELDTAYAIDGAKKGGSGDLVAYITYSLERADCDIPEDKLRHQAR